MMVLACAAHVDKRKKPIFRKYLLLSGAVSALRAPCSVLPRVNSAAYLPVDVLSLKLVNVYLPLADNSVT